MIITHDGNHHADEVFACAMLRILHPDMPILRTRDKEAFAKGTFIVDVGGRFDNERYFDHHQQPFDEDCHVLGLDSMRNDKVIPYASAGLVWRRFGLDILKRAGHPSTVSMLKRVDQLLIEGIDAVDTGMVQSTHTSYVGAPIRINSLSGVVSMLDDFDDALVLATRLLNNTMTRAERKEHATTVVRNSEVKAHTLILNESIPWVEAAFERDDINNILYTVYPREDGSWAAQAVPTEIDSFTNKKPFPESWRGLAGDDLSAVTGVYDSTFCHRTGYLAIAKSKEGAILLAALAQLV